MEAVVCHPDPLRDKGLIPSAFGSAVSRESSAVSPLWKLPQLKSCLARVQAPLVSLYPMTV